MYAPTVLTDTQERRIDQSVLIMGLIVAALGAVNLAARLLAWPNPQFLPVGGQHWLTENIAIAVVFLGLASTLILRKHYCDSPQSKAQIKMARLVCVAVPAVIGLSFLIRHVGLLFYHLDFLMSPTVSISFFSAVCSVLGSLSLAVFCTARHKPWASVYVVGVTGLVLIALGSFVGFGHIFKLPLLFTLRISSFAPMAFILIGMTMLVGSLSYGGLMLPAFSRIARVRFLFWLALSAGLFLLVENMSTIGEISRHVGLRHLLTISDMAMYAVLELTSALTTIVVVILFLRALTYYNDSMVYAAGQSILARKEKTLRHVLQSVCGNRNLEDIFQKVCQEVGEELGADRCFISRFQEGKLSSPIWEYRSSPSVSSILSVSAEDWETMNQFSRLACLVPQPFEFGPDGLGDNQISDLNDVLALIRQVQVTAGLGCCIIHQGECKAMIFLHQTGAPRPWQKVEKDILELVGKQLGAAINQAELYLAQQASDLKFKLLVDGVKEYAIYFLDANGYISTWNEGTERLTGYSANDVVGKHFSRLYHLNEVPEWYCEHVLEIASDTGHYEEEGRRQRKDGTIYWVSVVTTALRDETGRLVGYSRVMRDTSERKAAEQELERAKESAELANTRKSKTLTVISHEFKTSLNAIIGYADMVFLGKATTAARVSNYVKIIGDSGRYLLNIVNDILDIAQAESGKMRLSFRWLDPVQLLAELEPVITIQAEVRDIQLRFETDPNLPQVFWDPGRIKQVLLNLLSNAVKYNREQGLITVRMRVNENHDVLTCQVQDTGIGIPEDKMEDIFMEFYRLGGMAQSQPGTGLGLTLTRRLVEMHGGAITVESLEGVGSTFTVTLPVHAVSESVNASEKSAVELGEESSEANHHTQNLPTALIAPNSVDTKESHPSA